MPTRTAQNPEKDRADTVADLLTRLQPEPGDILLFHHPERFRSRVISWFTRSPFYHVGLYAGEGKVIEARIPAVECRDLYRQKDGYRFVVLRAPSRDSGQKALAWAEAQIGARYDLRCLILLVLARLLFWPSLCRSSCSESFVCGNFVARAFREAGIDLFPGRHHAALVPGDYQLLRHRKRSAGRALNVDTAPSPRYTNATSPTPLTPSREADKERDPLLPVYQSAA